MITNYFNAILPGWNLLNPLPPSSHSQRKLTTVPKVKKVELKLPLESNTPTFYFFHILDDVSSLIQIEEKIPAYLSTPAKDILEKIIFLLTKDLTVKISVRHIVASPELKEIFSPDASKLLPKFKDQDVLFPMGTQATKIVIKDSQPLHLIHSSIKTIVKNIVTERNSQEITLNIVPLFHPEMLTINTSLKRPTWESLKHTIPLLVKLVSSTRPL